MAESGVGAVVAGFLMLLAVAMVVGGILAAGFRDSQNAASISKTNIKYHDSHLFAVDALQRRLYHLCDDPFMIPAIVEGSEKSKQDVIQFTCYLLGCYLAWASIWRRRSVVFGYATNGVNKDHPNLARKFGVTITKGTHPSLPGSLFGLPNGSIAAISSLMVDRDEDRDRPIGYLTFLDNWDEDSSFRTWFQPWTDGLNILAKARSGGNLDQGLDDRLRELQHILVDMVRFFDKNSIAVRPADMPLCSRRLTTEVYGLRDIQGGSEDTAPLLPA